MEKKFYPLLLWIFLGSLLSAKAQDSAYDKLPPCSTDYKTQQDSGKAPYFVYQASWSYGSGQDSSGYRFTCFPDELNCSYRWDFGDHSPISSDWFASHLYTDSGSYPVTLTVIRNLATGACVSRSTRILHTVPIIYQDSLQIAVVQDPKNPAIYTYTLLDSTGVDSATWVESNNGDSLNLLHFSGMQLRYTAPQPGCYSMTLFGYRKNSILYSEVGGACIDSIPGSNDFFAPCFPNPAGSQTYLILNLGEAATISVLIFNSSGNEVQSTTVPGTIGENVITLSVGNLPTGTYYIQATYDNQIRKSKFVKL